MKLRVSFILAGVIAIAACDKGSDKGAGKDKAAEEKGKKDDDKKKGDDDDKGKKKADDDDKGKKKAAADDDKKKADDDKGAKKADDDDKAAPKKPAKDVAMPERTAIPKLADWNGAKEADVGKGNDVNCELKIVKEWLRVSCRKKSPGGGEPTGVVVTHGKNKDTFLFSAKGVASMVTPVLPGTDLQAKFSWSDVVWAVEVDWPKTDDRPEKFVRFHKTDDEPTKAIGEATCACYKKFYKAKECAESDENWRMTSVNPACERSYKDDCEKMVECGRGEPGAAPKCLDDQVLILPGNMCAPKCGKGDACPKGMVCSDTPTGKRACNDE